MRFKGTVLVINVKDGHGPIHNASAVAVVGKSKLTIINSWKKRWWLYYILGF